MLPIFMLLLIILCTTIQPSKGWYQCNNGTNYTQGSPIIQNLQHVLRVLPNETASSKKGYHTIVYGQSPNKVYAMAMCRGDQTETQCRDCLLGPDASLQTLCGLKPGARAMATECSVRWENASFSATPDLKWATLLNDNEAFNTTANSLAFHNLTGKLIGEALGSNNTKRYAAGKAAVDSINDIYVQIQCWGDINDEDCKSCFAGAADKIGTMEASIAFTGNCYVDYADHLFFVPPPPAPAVAPAPLNALLPPYSISHKKKPEEKSTNKLAVILGSGGGSMLLLFFLVSTYFLMTHRKHKSSHTTEVVQESDFENDDQNIFFTIETIRDATSNFHDNCKLGEGGFGIVYKGFLSNGKDVAIKKLSIGSSQGKNEFMTEIRLMTRVQHRNLVNLLGCCIDGSERILVYEYLAKKSLDKHLFDLEKKRFLDWNKRMNIILGVAKGLLYLHEDSKLRIIHRDIKVSNILLDNNFNAKIADFGLAKLFSEDQSYIQTRVAGTYGYMAPEYAMCGELSTKADVYSFGIIVLEIISGRPIIEVSSNSHEYLLGWAWKLYRTGKLHRIMDKDIKEAHNYEKILRFCHVGLLCTQADPSLRPIMSEVMAMLSSNSVTLPNPTTPAFISTTINSTFQRNIEFFSTS